MCPYLPSISLAYGVGVDVPTAKRDDFALKAEMLEAAITPKTRVLMLNFPTNPTGAVMPDDELKKIAALCIKHDIIVITDEIYSELRYDEEEHLSIASLPGMRERTILLHGFSKAYSMTGFRLGYACAPAPLIEAMMKIHQYAMLCAPITSQAAALEALQNGDAAMNEMRESYHHRRDFTVKRLNEMGIDCHAPGGAFYVFPRYSTLQGSPVRTLPPSFLRQRTWLPFQEMPLAPQGRDSSVAATRHPLMS